MAYLKFKNIRTQSERAERVAELLTEMDEYERCDHRNVVAAVKDRLGVTTQTAWSWVKDYEYVFDDHFPRCAQSMHMHMANAAILEFWNNPEVKSSFMQASNFKNKSYGAFRRWLKETGQLSAKGLVM